MDLENLTESELLDKLEETRELEGKSKLELAEELNVSRRTYHRWVKGEDKPNNLNRDKIKMYIARSKVEESMEKVKKEFNKSDETIKTRLLWATLPESRWKELEELEEEKGESVVTDALEKYLENEKVKIS